MPNQIFERNSFKTKKTRLPRMNEVTSYVRTENGQIIILKGDRQSFRCRQRSRLEDGTLSISLKFISFKEMKREIKKGKVGLVTINNFYTMSRL
jgi:hypothetical protein